MVRTPAFRHDTSLTESKPYRPLRAEHLPSPTGPSPLPNGCPAPAPAAMRLSAALGRPSTPPTKTTSSSARKATAPLARGLPRLWPWLLTCSARTALGFLAGTLRELDRHFLRDSQGKLTNTPTAPTAGQPTDWSFGRLVDQLVLFFGKMFSLDHKAGVMPAALALRHLVQMKHFSPQRSSSILDDICQLGDDFHRQVTSTRHEIYSLLSLLLGDDEVRTHLRSQDSRSGELMAGLLQLCHQERDPGNLVVWFGVLRLFLLEYVETAELVGDIFGTYSPYFPVSMRSSTTPSGITIDDLKLALRGCFSASHLAAGKVIGFLVEKLDQGDAVSLLVKVYPSRRPRFLTGTIKG